MRIILLLVFAFSFQVFGQQIQWEQTYGNGWVCHIIVTDDGDYLFATYGSGVSKNDSKLIKINKSGKVIWEQTYSGYEIASLVNHPDSGYILSGYKIGQKGTWLAKVSYTGELVWEHFYSSGYKKVFNSGLIITSDTGYVMSWKETKYGDRQNYEYINFRKVNNAGHKLWEKTYEKKHRTTGYNLIATNNNSYLLAGSTGISIQDLWLIEIDFKGNKVWEKTEGGLKDDIIHDLLITQKNHYILTGCTASKTGHHDVWLIEVDSKGNKVWEKHYGGYNYEVAKAMTKSLDGGYLLAGLVRDKINKTENPIVIKVDAQGKKLWENKYEDETKSINDIITTEEGNYILAGKKGNEIWLASIKESLTQQDK